MVWLIISSNQLPSTFWWWLEVQSWKCAWEQHHWKQWPWVRPMQLDRIWHCIGPHCSYHRTPCSHSLRPVTNKNYRDYYSSLSNSAYRFSNQIVKVFPSFTTAQLGDLFQGTILEAVGRAASASDSKIHWQSGHLFQHGHMLLTTFSNCVSLGRILEALDVLQEFSSMSRVVTMSVQMLLGVSQYFENHWLECTLHARFSFVFQTLKTSFGFPVIQTNMSINS